jgi:hypothetical protein
LAVVNVFDALIFSDDLFHTLAASHEKLFFDFVDLTTSERPPEVRHSFFCDSFQAKLNVFLFHLFP